MKNRGTHNIIYLLLGMLVTSCQEDFPPAPDYYQRPKINVSEKWRYRVPKNERVIWIGSSNGTVVYLTNTFDEKKLTTYEFTKGGELIQTHKFVGGNYAEDVKEYRKFRQEDDWISIRKGYRLLLLNYKTGEAYNLVNASDSKTQKPFDYFLGTQNRCFYQRLDQDGNLLAMVWNLSSKQENILGILGDRQSNLKLMGERTNHDRSFDTDLLYLQSKFELETGTIAYNIVGMFDDAFWGKKKWASDIIFRSSSNNYFDIAYLHNQYTAIVLDQQMICLIDHNLRKLVWKKNTGGRMNSNVIFDNTKMYYVEGDYLYSINYASGTQNWRKGFGYAVNQIAAGKEWIIIPSYREASNELFPPYSNQMNIADARYGEQVYRNADPLNVGSEVLDHIFRGVSHAVHFENNTLFCADHQYFMALNLKRE